MPICENQHFHGWTECLPAKMNQEKQKKEKSVEARRAHPQDRRAHPAPPQPLLDLLAVDVGTVVGKRASPRSAGVGRDCPLSTGGGRGRPRSVPPPPYAQI
jgi:hypothetical protein